MLVAAGTSHVNNDAGPLIWGQVGLFLLLWFFNDATGNSGVSGNAKLVLMVRSDAAQSLLLSLHMFD